MLKLQKPVLAIHVISAVGVLGADFALLALAISGFRGTDAQAIYPAAHLLASRVIAPLAGVTLATGLGLSALTSHGLFRYWWVTIKLVITIVLSVLIVFVLSPALDQAANAAVIGGSLALTDAQRVRFVVAPATASILLMSSVVLALYKPRWRLPA